jgi:iron complex outermembrane receptor protein
LTKVKIIDKATFASAKEGIDARGNARGSMKFTSILRLSSASAVVALALQSPAAAQDAGRSEVSADQIETVVVTARHRAEDEQNVPVAMTVVTGEQIEAAGHDKMSDIYEQIPTLRVDNFNPRNAILQIRGIGANLANESLVNSVGVYIDGVYYARPGASDFDMIDIAQIEVLRGPQGTLFGKNTTAGTLNITTRMPTSAPEFLMQATGGNYGYYRFAATASGSFSDTLSARLSGSISNRDGFVDNVRTGEDVNAANDKSARGQIFYHPNDDFSLRLIADYSFERPRCCVNSVSQVVSTDDDGTPIANGFLARAAAQGYTPIVSPTKKVTDIDSPQWIRTEQWGGSAQADWNVLGHSLTSITAYRTWRFDPHSDLDLIGLPILINGAFNSHSRQFSQELRVASPSNQTVEYVVGGYYFSEVLQSDTFEEFGAAAGPWYVPGLPSSITIGAYDGLQGVGYDRANTSSMAAFGQATWHVNDRLAVTGGLRYTYEKKWGYSYQTDAAGAPLSSFPTALQGTIRAVRVATVPTYDTRTISGFPQKYDEGNVSGTASVTYKVDDDVNVYATYARGYKSGGINFAVVPAGASNIIKPEIVDDYEFGLKSSAFNDHMILNLAAFWTDVSDYQSTQLYSSPTGAFVAYVTNAAQIRSRGLELDSDMALAPGWTARASGAYTDAIYLSYPNAPCPLVNPTGRCDLTGEALRNVSKWSSYLSTTYEFPFALGTFRDESVRLFTLASMSHRSGYYGSATRRSHIGATTLVDATLGLKLDDSSTVLSFWVHNLFDTTYYRENAPSGATGMLDVAFGPPRTLGVTLRQKF